MINTINIVFIDMVVGTLGISEDEKVPIKNILYDLVQLKRYGARYHSAKINGRYGNTYSFEIPCDTEQGYFIVTIAIFPRCFAHNFLNVGFNPTKMGTNGHKLLRQLLIKILGVNTARTLFYEIRLTRIDLTIDCQDVGDDYFIYMARASVSEIIRSDSGTIESQIAGSSDSNLRVTLYDKDIERGVSPDSHSNWSRLEVRIRELGFSISNITDMLENHFKKISFYQSAFMADSYFESAFTDKVTATGINSALHGMEPNKRRRYMRRLDRYSCDPFDLNSLRKSDLKLAVKVLDFLRSDNYVPSDGGTDK